jgi:hypothetical protein
MTDPKSNASIPADIASLSEAELVEQILLQLPSEIRSNARGQLMDTTRVITSDRPVLGSLLAQLAQLRFAKHADEYKAAAALQKADADRRASRIRVTVVLSPDLGDASARAVVLRRPNDGGRPILLLREADMTNQDLYVGMLAAARAATQFGVNPDRAHRRIIRDTRVSASGAAVAAHFERHLELLRRAPKSSAHGLGNVRTMDVLTDPYQPARPSAP